MVSKEEVFNSLPEFDLDSNYLKEKLAESVKNNRKKIIVLDDDPTGTQTIHDVKVFTSLTRENIKHGLSSEDNIFYILTNSRSFTKEQTYEYHMEAGRIISEEAKKLGVDYVLISRSDSTLRGHFPLETKTLKKSIEYNSDKRFDGEILIPFFEEGKRYTINDNHYLEENGNLIKTEDTEFAKDRAFPYKSSNLYEYIEEKTEGEFTKDRITSITLEEIRNFEINKIENKLYNVENFDKVFVNAATYLDIKIFTYALYQVLDEKDFIFRTAASFVRELAGISEQELLDSEDLHVDTDMGGIIVVGSHTNKTTEQLKKLKEIDSIEFIEFNSDLVIDEDKFRVEISNTIDKVNKIIKKGKSVAIYTKREYFSLPNDTKEDELIRSTLISKAISTIVNSMKVRPKFVVAKGGITSSDIATDSLELKYANVLGQIYPGVPVWETPSDSKFPDIPFVIFPGNVGDYSSLKESVNKLV